MKSKFMRRAGALLLALALSVSLIPAAAAAGSVKYGIDPAGPVSMEAGEERELEAFADAPWDSVTWTSSNPTVVSIRGRASGESTVIRAVGNGSAAVIATFRFPGETTPRTARCTVKVSPEAGRSRAAGEETAEEPGGAGAAPDYAIPVTGISMSPRSLTLERGETGEIRANVIPGEATERTVHWKSSDREVAAVSPSSGSPVTVTGGIPGKAVITAITEDGGLEDVCEVEVSGITLEETSKRLYTNSRFDLVAGVFGRARGEAVVWSSSNPAVASVSTSGRVVAGSMTGRTVITAAVYNTSYRATCEVTVEENLAAAITREISAGDTLEFSDLRTELNRLANSVREEDLDYVTNLQVSTGQGTLFYGYVSPETPNHGVGGIERFYYSGSGAGGRMALSGVTFVPKSGFDGVAVISYTAYCEDGFSFNGTIRVEIEADGGGYGGDVTLSTGANRPLTLTAETFKDICRMRTGRSASYVTFDQPSAGRGTLYYRYSSAGEYSQRVRSTDRYYISGSPSVELVTFVPAENYTGTISIGYRCTDTTGSTYRGTITVNVYAVSGQGGGSVEYTTEINQRVKLKAGDFEELCEETNDETLSYIYFDSLPAVSQGILYYNYSSSSSSRVDTSTRYHRSSGSRISNISFVPAEDYSGTVTIPFTGYDTAGDTFAGNLIIEVTGESGTVSYSTRSGQAVTFSSSHFNSACQRVNGADLDYITFELPASRTGTLYRGYKSSSSTGTRISSTDRFYRRSGNTVSDVTFVPKSGYSGTVSISFRGYDIDGDRFSGTVEITVGGGGDGDDVIRYSVSSGGVVDFDADDFNDACRNVTGENLDYVRFDLPASRYGTLYYQYDEDRDTGTRVTGSNSYYRRGSSRLLDNVSFVAGSTTGTVTIDYDGRSTGGDSFSGTVEITVGRGGGSGRAIRYSTAAGGVVDFDAGDFNDACQDVTGESLDYVNFELPASRYGTLYYQYDESRDAGTRVTSSNSYYRRNGSRLLSDVSFVAGSTTGTVTIDYSGRSTGGGRFSGTVEITVESSGSFSGIYYTGSSLPIQLRAADFESACRAAVGGTLSYIRLDSLPGAYTGRLYVNYTSPSRPGTTAAAGVSYYAGGTPSVGQLTFVPKADYEGRLVLSYTGYNTQGRSYGGTVILNLSNSYGASSFTDVDGDWEWAKPSIEFLRSAGVTGGYSDGTFRPARPVSRGEFTLMVCRAFGFDTGSGVSSGFPDVPSDSIYAGAVAAARDLGIVGGKNGLFMPGDPINNQGAMTMVCRAMQAAGMSVPRASASLLDAFEDGEQVSGYARESVASLLQLGVVQGNASMTLNPSASITRAEMAVMLHRVLTL